MAPHDRLRRPPEAALDRLVLPSVPPGPPECTLDAAGIRLAATPSPPRRDAVDVACWTRVDHASRPGDAVESSETDSASNSTSESDPSPSATLLADPPMPGETDGTVTHTLVLGAETPPLSVRVDYDPLPLRILSPAGTRVTTEDGSSVDGVVPTVASDGALVLTFTDPPTDGPLFIEYEVSRNPDAGRHCVDVVVNGTWETEAGLVLLG